MAKTKGAKVSVNQFDKICEVLNDKTTITHTFYAPNGGEVLVEITKTLSLSEFTQFVTDVKNNCFDDNGNYHATLKEFMIKVCTLRYFTNISLPANWSNLWDALYNTSVVEDVLAHINPIQYAEILNAVDEQIEFEKLTQKKALDAVIKQMNDAVEQIQNMMSPENMKMIDAVMKETVGRGISNEELINTLTKGKGADNGIGFVEKDDTGTE